MSTAMARPRPGHLGHRRWIAGFTTLYLEVEAGLRPVRHIRPLLAVDLRLRLGGGGRPGPIPEIRRILVQCRDDVCEAVVLLHQHDRTSALVMALHHQPEGWRITELSRPEHPRPAGSEDLDDATAPPPTGDAWAITTATHPPGPRWRLPQGWAADAA